MCGIAGIFSLNSPKVEWIKEMTNALRHRGPDDEGFLAVDVNKRQFYPLSGEESKIANQRIETFEQPVNLLLGHRRLSILDTTPAGHQPMSNASKTLWVIHNGEIYNYIELRKELVQKGYVFHTNTDTEVILAAYEEWGEECLSRFNGMWAFVIYDQRKNMLFGVRDRFGVKPFYYYHDTNSFAFASEIKALLQLPFIKKEINPKAVFDYLIFTWQENEEEGFFKNIFELPPSFAFFYDLTERTFKKWRYYTLNYTDEWVKFNSNQLNIYAQTTRQLIYDAVALRLRSDVAVGSCLSGGVDSSTIVCVIDDLLKTEKMTQIGDQQRAFTASYDLKEVDESHWAKIVVDDTKTAWYQTFPKPNELISDMEDLIYTQDIPFGSTSIYAQYRVMKLVKENGVKVLLDGQGGDELFTGYVGYYRPFFGEIIKHLDFKTFINEILHIGNSPLNIKPLLLSLLRLYGAKILPSFLKKIIIRFQHKENNYVNEDFFKEYSERMKLLTERALTSLNQTLAEFITSKNLKTLLRYEDRNSMRFSIESRTPFADDINLIEYVFQIPGIYKMHDGWSKYLLRESVKGLVPEVIRCRKDKKGFATPEYYWLNAVKNELRTYFTDDLHPYLDVKKIWEDWDALVVVQDKTGITQIWPLINLAIWKKTYGL